MSEYASGKRKTAGMYPSSIDSWMVQSPVCGMASGLPSNRFEQCSFYPGVFKVVGDGIIDGGDILVSLFVLTFIFGFVLMSGVIVS